MSARPVQEKQRRRVAKAFRRQPLKAWIDPLQWLLDHGHVTTKREGRELVLAGRLKSESHTVGIGEGMIQEGEILKRGKIVMLVPAELRATMRVEKA